MYEKKAIIPVLDVERRRKEIHQKLAYIGRMTDGRALGVESSLYKKMIQEREDLRQELKKYPRLGDNPKKIVKKTLEDKRWGVNTVSNIIYNHYYKKS